MNLVYKSQRLPKTIPNLIYLTAPYCDPDPAIREQRFQQANRLAGALINEEIMVFSTVTHRHAIATASKVLVACDFDRQYEMQFVSACRAALVLCPNGVDPESSVIVSIFEQMRKPVYYLHSFPDESQSQEWITFSEIVAAIKGKPPKPWLFRLFCRR